MNEILRICVIVYSGVNRAWAAFSTLEVTSEYQADVGEASRLLGEAGMQLFLAMGILKNVLNDINQKSKG